jgi:outer membrane protein
MKHNMSMQRLRETQVAWRASALWANGALAMLACLGAQMSVAQPLDLMQAWTRARQTDPQMAATQAVRSTAQALRQQADAIWRPSVVASATGGAMNQASRVAGAEFSGPGMSSVSGVNFNTSVNHGTVGRWSVQARQPLYNPEREAQRQQLGVGAAAADWQADLQQQQLMLATAQRYLDVVLADRRWQVLRQQLVAVERAYTEAKDRYALGDAPITDTHEAAARARGLQAQVSAADSDRSMARTVLADSIGGVPDQLSLRVPGPMGSWRLPSLEESIAVARSGNPGLLLQGAQVQSSLQEANKHTMKAAPTLDAVAVLARDHLSGQGDYGSASTQQSQQMLGVTLTVPLYTGGWRDGKWREAQGQADNATAELQTAQRQVQQQLRATWLALNTGPTRVLALQEALKASAARLDATRLGRQVGDRTTLELLAAENDLAAAELALLQLRADLLLARLRFDALQGRLSEQSLQEVNASLGDAAVDALPTR